MKKNILILGLAVAAMSSCTNDEVLEQAQPVQKVIGFDGFVNKTTRANGQIGSVERASLTNFWVLANYGNDASSYSPLYENPENIYWDETNEVWKSTTTRYWTNNTYNFVAYADDNTSTTAPDYVSITDGGALQINDYVLDYILTDAANNNVDVIPTKSNQKDIVADVRTIEGKQNNDEKVSFTFNHLLSKVKFTVVNNGSFPMAITALKISGINKKGSINIEENTDLTTSSVWTLPEDEANKEIITIYPIKATNNIAASAQVASAEFLVLPQSLTDVKVEIKADFYHDNDIVDTKDFTGNSALNLAVSGYEYWIPNNFYNYTISLPAAGKQIEFNVSGVETWTPAAGTDSSDGSLNTIELNGNSGSN